MNNVTRLVIALAFGSVALAGACGGSDDKGTGGSGGGKGGAAGAGGSPENTGTQCKAAAECYPGIDAGTLSGAAQCLTVPGGYCTHICAADTDCCKAAGECKTDLKEVCSPFESTGQKMCFLSCEAGDLKDPDGGAVASDAEYCQRYASSSFICRSTGGGAQNRKVCLPGTCGVGQSCGADTDCATGLSCVTGFKGGYCSKQGCTANADCPQGSVCVTSGGKNYCFASCTADTDCSFCRPWDLRSTCTATDVTFVDTDGGTPGTVCVPPA